MSTENEEVIVGDEAEGETVTVVADEETEVKVESADEVETE